jgi:hypothetical protein
MIYDQNCDLLIGNTATEAFFNSDSYFYTLRSGKSAILDDVLLNCELAQSREPVFAIKKHRVYDLILPVMAGNEKIGFVASRHFRSTLQR